MIHSFNDSKERRMTSSCSKKLFALLRGIMLNMMVIFIVSVVFIRLEEKNKLELHKKVCENKDNAFLRH